MDKKMRVLVAEEDSSFLKMIEDSLKASGTPYHLQNAGETANMVGKQAVRHGDVAIDRQWNLDEQG